MIINKSVKNLITIINIFYKKDQLISFKWLWSANLFWNPLIERVLLLFHIFECDSWFWLEIRIIAE